MVVLGEALFLMSEVPLYRMIHTPVGGHVHINTPFCGQDQIPQLARGELDPKEGLGRSCRGTLLIRNTHPPWITIGP